MARNEGSRDVRDAMTVSVSLIGPVYIATYHRGLSNRRDDPLSSKQNDAAAAIPTSFVIYCISMSRLDQFPASCHDIHSTLGRIRVSPAIAAQPFPRCSPMATV